MKFFGELRREQYQTTLRTVGEILILRDGNLFKNKYNFPSKCIEVLMYNTPIKSLFKITGLPEELYEGLPLDRSNKEYQTENIDYFLNSRKSCARKKNFIYLYSAKFKEQA